MYPSKDNLARSAVKRLLTKPGLYLNGGCVKSLLPPVAAEYYFERHVISTISRSEIVEMTCLSKHNSARSAVKNLFTQPPFKEYFAGAGGEIFFTQALNLVKGTGGLFAEADFVEVFAPVFDRLDAAEFVEFFEKFEICICNDGHFGIGGCFGADAITGEGKI